jgi:hypothetical protein
LRAYDLGGVEQRAALQGVHEEHAAALCQHLLDGEVLLAGMAELGPVARHGGLEFEQAVLDEEVDAQGRHALVHRHHADERVPLPGPALRAARQSAPEVHHRPAVHVGRDGGAHLAVALEVLREERAQLLESGLARSLDVHLLHGCVSPDRWYMLSPVGRIRAREARMTSTPLVPCQMEVLSVLAGASLELEVDHAH